jgi:hypothetical protein
MVSGVGTAACWQAARTMLNATSTLKKSKPFDLVFIFLLQILQIKMNGFSISCHDKTFEPKLSF